jgi:hypothetical protein
MEAMYPNSRGFGDADAGVVGVCGLEAWTEVTASRRLANMSQRKPGLLLT